MKFLVLALCVSVASAASFGSPIASLISGYGGYTQPAQRYQPFKQPAVKVVPNYDAAAPSVITNTAYATAKAVVNAPIVAAKTIVSAPVPAVQTYKAEFNGKESEAPIVRSDSEVSAEGFNYAYQTGNGISAEASGQLKDAQTIVVQGQYRYTAPDGTPVAFSYVADENGYQPQSDLLPVGPAIPEAILRSLQYIASHPSKNAEY